MLKWAQAAPYDEAYAHLYLYLDKMAYVDVFKHVQIINLKL